MKDLITSVQNPIVKHIKSLHKKKYRDQYQQYYVEGIKMVDEALKENTPVEMVVVSEGFKWKDYSILKDLEAESIPIRIVSPSVFKHISDVKSPQGIIAVVGKKDFNICDVLEKSAFFLVILDEVQDPGNVGSIIRTVDAAGGDGVVLLKGTADPYNPKTLRATMGSIFRIPVLEVEDYKVLFEGLIKRHVYIMASCIEGQNVFGITGGHAKKALIIGNESKGIKKEILEISSNIISIPMIGGTESLNASVAAGVLIYEIMRKDGNFQ